MFEETLILQESTVMALTGERRIKKQIARLKKSRVPFYINAKGRPILIRSKTTFALARRLYNSAKCGSKIRGCEFSLTIDEILELLELANGHCQVSGIEFSLERKEGWRRSPYIPSLDRVDGSKGYKKSNCRIVCLVVNIALNEWGFDVLKRVSEGILNGRNGQIGLSI